MGASLLWSCAGGIDPTDSESFPGANSPNSGAAGAPVSGAAGHGGSGGSAKTMNGAAGQPVSGAAGSGNVTPPTTGAAGQAGSDGVAPPMTGAAGSDSVAPPTTGAAGAGSATPPTTGAAGSGAVVPPTTGAAGSGNVTPPTTGAAGSGTVAPPPTTTGAAGSATVAPPPTTTGAAGSGTVVPPPTTTGAAGSASVAPPTTGAAGQAGTAVVTPPPGGTTGTATPPPTTPPPTTPPPTTPATSAGSTIVPLYTSPGDASWNAVIAAKTAHPKVGVVAIVNPNNGPGGAVDSAYASGIARLTAAGIRVIGYVATGYTANSPASVKADIDRWKAFYPGQITGIFFDEQSNKAEHVAYYRDLSQYTKAQGLSFTVGNPGTDTAEGFVGALDMMLIYESAGVPSTAAMGGWHTKYAPSNFGIIPYAANLDPAFVKTARQYVGYVYVQSDNLPNPWDSVPSYFSALLAALE